MHQQEHDAQEIKRIMSCVKTASPIIKRLASCQKYLGSFRSARTPRSNAFTGPVSEAREVCPAAAMAVIASDLVFQREDAGVMSVSCSAFQVAKLSLLAGQN